MNVHAASTIRGTALAAALTALAACSGAAGTPAQSPAASPTPAGAATPLKFSFDGSPPPGWSVSGESGLLSFSIEEDGASMTVELLPNRALMDDGCKLGPEPGVAATARAISDAVASRRGLVASNRTSVTVSGLTGEQMDLRVDPAAGASCPKDGPEFVPIVGFAGPAGWEYVGLGTSEASRFIVLDAAGGQNVIVIVFAPDTAMFDRHIDEAASIIDHVAIDS